MLPGMKALLITVSLLIPGVVTGYEQRINNVYYAVTGDSIEELWADVLMKTPVEHEGRKHVAYTRWQVTWRFNWRYDGSACDITSVKTRLDVTYTLPRLELAATAPDELLGRWEAYYAALFDHEQGHKELGAKAAMQIDDEIRNMGSRTTCAQLERDANAIGKKVIEEYSRIEKEYDRSTNHGLNSGVAFP